MASAREILQRASTPEELLGKLLEAADLLEGKLEASQQHATAYFAMASGLWEAAGALSLLLTKPRQPRRALERGVRPPWPSPTAGSTPASTAALPSSGCGVDACLVQRWRNASGCWWQWRWNWRRGGCWIATGSARTVGADRTGCCQGLRPMPAQ